MGDTNETSNRNDVIDLNNVNENDAMTNYFMVKEEKPVIIPGCISIFFFIICFSFSIAILMINPYKGKNFTYLTDNWELNPIKGIEIKDKSSSKIDSIDNVEKKEIYNWDKKTFKLQRLDSNYIKMSETNDKLCGTDNYGNKLYVSDNDDCPINYLYIGNTLPSNINFNIKTIPLNNGKNIYFSNENIEGKIITDIRVGGIKECGICYYLENYCNKINYKLCKYRDNYNTLIDIISIKDYIEDNELESSDNDDKDIGLYYSSYISLEKESISSDLKKLYNKKKQGIFIKKLIFLIFLIITFIFTLTILGIDNKPKKIFLNLINIGLIGITLIVHFSSLKEYNSITSNIISNIKSPLTEELIYSKIWNYYYVYEIIYIISLIIYGILNFIMLFLLFMNEKRNFRCTLCDYNWCRIPIKILLRIHCCGFQLFYCSKKKNTKIQNNFYKRKLAFENILTILYSDNTFNSNNPRYTVEFNDKESSHFETSYDKEFKQNIDLSGLDYKLKKFFELIEEKFK